MILVTTGAQGNNVVPRISFFFPFQEESLRDMVGACHVSIDAREPKVSSDQNFPLVERGTGEREKRKGLWTNIWGRRSTAPAVHQILFRSYWREH